MSEVQSFTLTLEQQSDYVFRIAFDDTTIPSLHTDEPAPLGGDSGPNPSRLLQQFEDFCVVTESVRSGVEVAVTVRDGSGLLLHDRAAIASGA